jgi:hypothetical protein
VSRLRRQAILVSAPIAMSSGIGDKRKLSPTHHFQNLPLIEDVMSALEQSMICSNDPICADHRPGNRNGDRATHGAACHACLLIAETSCEMGS